jgi:hypothetical protein
MEMKEETFVDLVQGQGRIEQAIQDVSKRLDGALPALYNQQITLEGRIGKVENRQWYISGIGTAIGVGLGSIFAWFKR